MNYAIVFLGAGLGGTLRYAISQGIKLYFPFIQFPLATFIINILGSALIAFVYSFFAQNDSSKIILFLTTGFLGGFTTFSTFMFENYQIFSQNSWEIGLAYSLGSFFLSFLAIALIMHFTTH